MDSDLNEIKLRQRLKWAALVTGIIFIAELVGGLLTNSLALISDSAHVLMDVLALLISWFAHYVSSKPPTETKTYGLHRFEVFASLINGLSLMAVSGFIFYRAAFRLFAPPEVESVGMLVVAFIGLAVNLFVAFYLRGFAGHDLNVKSAYFHVIGDAAASVGVIIAAIIIYYTGFNIADPIISVLIGVIVLTGAYKIVSESAHILLEGVPRAVNLKEVTKDIRAVEGVSDLHSLHIWSICYNIFSLSAHVDITEDWKERQADVFSRINENLAQAHGIFYTTLQAECDGCGANDLLRSFEHNHINDGHNHHHH